MKRWQIALGLFGLFVVLVGVYIYSALKSIDVEQLSDDLWVLRGMGGNTAVLRTNEGAVIVDTMTFILQGERIREVAAELTGSDSALLINTHYHFDHTHGNPAFDVGTQVVATERTLSHLNALDAEFWAGEAAALLPNVTFTDTYTLNIGGKTVELVHPGRGHTDGDLVVLFTDERVVHMGDLHFNDHYPNIDLEAGGTVVEWPVTLDAVSALPFDRVIPGHGLTTDRTGLDRYRAFIQQLGDLAAEAAADGVPLEAFVESADLTADAGFEPITFGPLPLGLDRTFVLTRAWQEATGNFERLN